LLQLEAYTLKSKLDVKEGLGLLESRTLEPDPNAAKALIEKKMQQKPDAPLRALLQDF